MEHADRLVVATYREFIPRDELRGDVEAIFSFVPGAPAVDARVLRQVLFRTGHSFCAPRFADGGASIALELGMTCTADGVWRESDCVGGFVIGPMREVGPAVPAKCPLMVGAYLKPGRLGAFLGVAASELTDNVVALDHLWRSTSALPAELADLDEGERAARLERELVHRRLRRSSPGVDVAGLTALVRQRRGLVTAQRLSDEAGVSRQHLTRVFRDVVGLTPKLYCRLVRFHAGLAYAGCGSAVEWAEVAQRLGYADQSHMIAEFKRFSSLTPGQLASRPWFHPFIERAKARRNAAIAARRPG
jgi:AraC-like DNA-binding protein